MHCENINDLIAHSVKNSAVGIVVTDHQGIITYVNSRQCASSGYGYDELIGKNARIFQSGETPHAVYQEMWSTILSGQLWQGQLLNKKKNGDAHWENVYVAPVLNHENEVTSFWAIKKDCYPRNVQKHDTKALSQIDPLTGLLNKNGFLLNFNKIILEQKREQSSGTITVYYVDIDRFHSINQNLGNQAADILLAEIARRLKRCFRLNDMVARLEDDNFGVFLSEPKKNDDDNKTIERLLNIIREVFNVGGRQIFITASIGSASFPECGGDAEEVLSAARLATKTAKSKGGDTYHLFSNSCTVKKPGHDLANDLLHAIDRDQLELYYQPQINSASGEIVGVEALLRWFRNEDELIPPNIFIPIAEKSELIVALGEWVLDQAVSQIVSWRKQGLPSTRVAVNLSAKHFHRTDLVPYIKKLLQKVALEPHYLELELTESAILQNPVEVKRNISELKSLGIRVSLDDFGTGHSSLVWLSQLPVDQVKIDKSFVSDVTVNPINASIVSATIAMAKKLDKDSIAEGVETEAQMHFLRRQGCDFLQGFLFSKPLPVAQITSLLQEKGKWSFADALPEQDRFTILVVDDEPQMVRVLQRIFRQSDYRVLSAHSGRDALEILALNRVQIIISDHLMPGMTGVELLSAIKKLYPDTIRIILSGHSDVSTIIDAINQGAIWKYFTKPVEIELLEKAVRKAYQNMFSGETV